MLDPEGVARGEERRIEGEVLELLELLLLVVVDDEAVLQHGAQPAPALEEGEHALPAGLVGQDDHAEEPDDALALHRRHGPREAVLADEVSQVEPDGRVDLLGRLVVAPVIAKLPSA